MGSFPMSRVYAQGPSLDSRCETGVAKCTGRGFTERFSSEGPRDGEGRSLHELDLTRRLLKYPCSYLIYSPAFDGLPTVAKDSIYQRMWQVLSGEEQGERYQKALSFEDRQAVTQILIDTKPDLPKYFQGNIR